MEKLRSTFATRSRKEEFDPRPTKNFRPPLATDPRCLTAFLQREIPSLSVRTSNISLEEIRSRGGRRNVFIPNSSSRPSVQQGLQNHEASQDILAPRPPSKLSVPNARASCRPSVQQRLQKQQATGSNTSTEILANNPSTWSQIDFEPSNVTTASVAVKRPWYPPVQEWYACNQEAISKKSPEGTVQSSSQSKNSVNISNAALPHKATSLGVGKKSAGYVLDPSTPPFQPRVLSTSNKGAGDAPSTLRPRNTFTVSNVQLSSETDVPASDINHKVHQPASGSVESSIPPSHLKKIPGAKLKPAGLRPKNSFCVSEAKVVREGSAKSCLKGTDERPFLGGKASEEVHVDCVEQDILQSTTAQSSHQHVSSVILKDSKDRKSSCDSDSGVDLPSQEVPSTLSGSPPSPVLQNSSYALGISRSVTLEDISDSSDDEYTPLEVFLLPVPEHLKKYTPLSAIDRSSSPCLNTTGISSGRSSSLSFSSMSISPPKEEPPISPSPTPSPDVDIAEPIAKQRKVDLPQLPSCNSLPQGEPEVNKELSWRREQRSAETIDKEQNALTLADFGLPDSFGSQVPKTTWLDESSIRAVDELFSKRFDFTPDNWNLPDTTYLFTSVPWEMPEFLDLKKKLNSVKEKLNDLPLQDWHAHTRRRNRAGNIIWKLRNKLEPELGTQAWCKFYENVSSFPLIPAQALREKSLKSVHLCEAPGAFVTALNHFLHSNYGSDFKWDWRATTLNPYYEGNQLSSMINDDRFIFHTIDKWSFGQDKTGNLMEPQNLLHLEEEAASMGEVLLVTADGSIVCQDNPAEQEGVVSWLQYCETVAALRLLAPGGSFLLKMFTFYEHLSICLMYLLNCAFKTVHVNKPVTSKEGNSEVYVICCEYLGSETFGPWLKILTEQYSSKPSPRAMFDQHHIPESFILQLHECADFFRMRQSVCMKENLRAFNEPSRKDMSYVAALRTKVAEEFFERYQLKKLDAKYRIVNKVALENTKAPNIDPRVEDVSYNDRLKRLSMSPVEELKCLRSDLQYMTVNWSANEQVFWMSLPEKLESFQITRGKPVSQVVSSKFCSGRLLNLRTRVRDIAQKFFKIDASRLSTDSNDLEYAWPFDPKHVRRVHPIDFKHTLWASLENGSTSICQIEAFQRIVSQLDKMSHRDCMELRGFPMLTQFSVSVIYMLGHLFDMIGFVRPQGQDLMVLLYGFRKWDPSLKKCIQDVSSNLMSGSEALLSFVPVSQIADGDFYTYVTEANNLCVIEQVKDLLKRMP